MARGRQANEVIPSVNIKELQVDCDLQGRWDVPGYGLLEARWVVDRTERDKAGLKYR